MKLEWVNDGITQGEHNNLMHNAYYAAQVIAKSAKRANALEALKQAHDAGYVSDATHIKVLKEILELEGYDIEFYENQKGGA